MTISGRFLALVLLSGCVAPTSHLSTISPELVRAEQLKQQQLVIQSGFAEQKRLEDLAWPMLRAAVPLCGKWVMARGGFSVSNVHSFDRQLQEAARSLGFSDTLVVTGVVAGSPAERTGIRIGDRLTEVAGQPAPTGRTAVAAFTARLTPRATSNRESALVATPVELSIRRTIAIDSTAEPRRFEVPRDTVCAYSSVATKDDQLNAWADGNQVWITTAMMRFAATDDELAVVVAHEIAHNAMRHIDAKNKNASAGAFIGLLADLALATQGVNTGGDFTNSGAAIGAMSYSQDFEREADYVGMYVLARTGRPFESAANFWRRMAQESPGSIKYASSHPTTAERFIRLEQIATELRRKIDAGDALIPDTKQNPLGSPDSY